MNRNLSYTSFGVSVLSTQLPRESEFRRLVQSLRAGRDVVIDADDVRDVYEIAILDNPNLAVLNYLTSQDNLNSFIFTAAMQGDDVGIVDKLIEMGTPNITDIFSDTVGVGNFKMARHLYRKYKDRIDFRSVVESRKRESGESLDLDSVFLAQLE